MLFAPCMAFDARTTVRVGSMQSDSPRLQPLKYAAIGQQRENLISVLPPVDTEKMTTLEIEFREMLEGILCTADEMEAITDPRMRAIYEGITASYYEPAVYRAFEVLYEDFAPIRVAGKMVYRKLKENMEESKMYKESQIEAVLSTTSLSSAEVKSCWAAFVRLAEDREIAVDKLARNLAIEDNVLKSKGRLTFEELVNAYDHTAWKSLANVLREALYFRSGESNVLDKQRAKHNKRYDDMLSQFEDWKAFVPEGEGRRLDILRGCFVGSENPKVVEALRFIYVDYTALRVSGNFIFKIVSAVMGAALRRRKQ